MKSVNKKYLFVLLTLSVVGGVLLSSCSDDDSGGEPFVSYIRITDPDASDSLLVTAGQGQMVAIMGRNLNGVRQLWFNDQPAVLNASFITGTTVITRVPSQIPNLVTNKMKMIFANGDSLIHDFTTDISEPRIDRMKSEYVADGDEAVFYGDFFYEPITVTFPGGVDGELVSVEDGEIHVKVPEGTVPGPVTISSNFGVGESNFWFKDDRNIIASFDGPTGGLWRGPDYIIASDPVITSVSSKFLRVNQNLGAWPFFELYGGPKESDLKDETKNIPEAALINPGAFSLKFEINTLKSLSGANMRVYIGNADNGLFDAERQSKYYVWQANLNTEGEWQTVTIPWEDVYDATQKFAYDPAGYAMFIYFHGPNALEHNFGLDNMRVVPNTPE